MKMCLVNLWIVSLLFLPGCRQAPGQAPIGQAQQGLPPIEIYFSPHGGCTEAVVKELNGAKTSVLVQAYSFPSTPIAKALLMAHKRGVTVQVILDKSQKTEKHSEADFLVNVGMQVQIDAKHAIAHNKIMDIDGTTVITGSFNFTKAAEESNAENLLVIRSPELAAKYTANWKVHADHSDPYAGRTEGYSETHRAESTGPPPGVVPTTTGYVASKNSAIFHRADCKSMSTISAKNLVRYNTRDEAIPAGKKPCHECKP